MIPDHTPPQSTNPARTPDLGVSRHAQMAEAFEIFAAGMGPFIDARMQEYFADEISWTETAANRMGRPAEHGATDPLFQLLVLRRFWGPVFAEFFGGDVRKLVDQLIEARNLWAHINLPDDTAYLDRILLSIERLLAPVSPEDTSELRRIRTRLRNPSDGDTAAAPVESVDSLVLRTQLIDSESAFQTLQDQQTQLATELDLARRASAGRQLRLSEVERELLEAAGRSEVLESYLEAERNSRNRLEWLFVGFIAVMLLVMVILAG